MKKIEIIYEDDRIMVLNKPEGVVTTKEGGGVKTVEDWLLEKFSWSADLARGGVAHRLDKGTSGLLVIAKDKGGLSVIKEQFKNRLIYKQYWALVEGKAVFEGEIRTPIGRSKYNFLKWAVDVDGREAWTKFDLIKVYESDGKKYSLLRVILKTGRTHQIRVHLSYLGWPLVGDRLYGGKTNLLARPFLHSKMIALLHPDGYSFEVEMGLSNDLVSVLEKL